MLRKTHIFFDSLRTSSQTQKNSWHKNLSYFSLGGRKQFGAWLGNKGSFRCMCHWDTWRKGLQHACFLRKGIQWENRLQILTGIILIRLGLNPGQDCFPGIWWLLQDPSELLPHSPSPKWWFLGHFTHQLLKLVLHFCHTERKCVLWATFFHTLQIYISIYISYVSRRRQFGGYWIY